MLRWRHSVQGSQHECVEPAGAKAPQQQSHRHRVYRTRDTLSLPCSTMYCNPHRHIVLSRVCSRDKSFALALIPGPAARIQHQPHFEPAGLFLKKSRTSLPCPVQSRSENALEQLRKLVHGEIGLERQASYVVAFGTPAATIIQEARNEQADLIVVGARGPSHASAVSHFGGGTAYRVAADADCPVLTIRHD